MNYEITRAHSLPTRADRELSRQLAQVDRAAFLDVAKTERAALVEAAKIQGIGFVTTLALHEVGSLTYLETELIKVHPLGEARFQAIVDTATAAVATRISRHALR